MVGQILTQWTTLGGDFVLLEPYIGKRADKELRRLPVQCARTIMQRIERSQPPPTTRKTKKAPEGAFNMLRLVRQAD